eukprot:3378170-Pleurochrysis_carterae.AAC.1
MRLAHRRSGCAVKFPRACRISMIAFGRQPATQWSEGPLLQLCSPSHRRFSSSDHPPHSDLSPGQARPPSRQLHSWPRRQLHSWPRARRRTAPRRAMTASCASRGGGCGCAHPPRSGVRPSFRARTRRAHVYLACVPRTCATCLRHTRAPHTCATHVRHACTPVRCDRQIEQQAHTHSQARPCAALPCSAGAQLLPIVPHAPHVHPSVRLPPSTLRHRSASTLHDRREIPIFTCTDVATLAPCLLTLTLALALPLR